MTVAPLVDVMTEFISSTIFREYDIRGVAGRDLTPTVAHSVGCAFSVLLADRCKTGAIVVGRDNRISGPELHGALVEGLTASGIEVWDAGEIPTPALYWTLQRRAVAGGIQVTASHNPPQFNGFKLCIGTAALYGDDIQRILALIHEGRRIRGRGSVRPIEVLDDYVNDIVSRIGPFDGNPAVVLDGSNGVGAAPARQVLERLGARITCLSCTSDGNFPDHPPDPSHAENLTGLSARVKAEHCGIGLAVDGDADRVGVIDGSGAMVPGDRVLALLAREILPRHAGASIIFDVKCSMALPKVIEDAGGVPLMWKTGHSLIEAKMAEVKSPLAGELSGHMYIGDGYYGFDDAIYAAARLLAIVSTRGKDIRTLLADVPEYPSTPELRIPCPDDRKFDVVRRAVEHFGSTHHVIQIDGARVDYGDGWGLIRASNTEPALVLRFEAKTDRRLKEIEGDMRGWLKTANAGHGPDNSAAGR
ncbi:MAG TPA: phosphomannomutase/phosphoglucomutase [Gemmatimonadaceae bacterium]|nr:phosphomannomutase/phosphoglucomutase [Gemmatimonadaceae bacterium]